MPLADYKTKAGVGWEVWAVRLLLLLALWVASSYFEARAFNSVTGKDVSTWDAMFIGLRVQEPAAQLRRTDRE